MYSIIQVLSVKPKNSTGFKSRCKIKEKQPTSKHLKDLSQASMDNATTNPLYHSHIPIRARMKAY
jgi:hypothetical protein